MKALKRKVADSYFDLVRRFPLVPIKSEKHYDAAIALLNRSLDAGQRDYLEALTRFVEDYEQQHHRIVAGRLKPLDALKYLMEQNVMKAIDLGKLLGSRSVASQILRGRRSLSKSHILVLCERFRVEPGLFLEN